MAPKVSASRDRRRWKRSDTIKVAATIHARISVPSDDTGSRTTTVMNPAAAMLAATNHWLALRSASTDALFWTLQLTGIAPLYRAMVNARFDSSSLQTKGGGAFRCRLFFHCRARDCRLPVCS